MNMRQLILIICIATMSWVAHAQQQPIVRAEVSRILLTAQEAVATKNYALALEKLTAARNVPDLNTAEWELVHRLSAVAGQYGGQPQLALNSLEELIAAPHVALVDKPVLLENLVNLALRERKFERVVLASKQYAAMAPYKRTVQVATVQAHYFLKNYAAACTEINNLLAQQGAQLAAPEEYLLRMRADSYKQLKDQSGYLSSLRFLLTYYPSRAYWSDYLSYQLDGLGKQSPYALDWYRLLRATQTLEDADDYVTLIELTLKAGLPDEAQAALNAGLQAGKLGVREIKAQTEQFSTQISKRIAEDTQSLGALEKQLATSPDGNAAAQAADLYMANRQWDKAQGLYAQALQKKGLRKEEMVRMRLGIALMHLAEKEQARQIFAWDGFDPAARNLAQSWLLWSAKP
jgi:hypothetical protein